MTHNLGLWEGELHILGFGMDPDDAAFEAALADQRDRRRQRFERTVDRLRELGLSIDAQVATIDRTDDDALGRPTVARALIDAGYAESVEDAFRRLLSWGSPAYIPRDGMGPAEAIAAIRAAGGLPVLAHFSEAPRTASTSSGSSSTRASAASRSTTGRSTPRRSVRSATWPRTCGSCATGGVRLPR